MGMTVEGITQPGRGPETSKNGKLAEVADIEVFREFHNLASVRHRIADALGIDRESKIGKILDTYREKWQTLILPDDDGLSFRRHQNDGAPPQSNAKLAMMLIKRFSLPGNGVETEEEVFKRGGPVTGRDFDLEQNP